MTVQNSIHADSLPYISRLRQRELKTIDLVVIHCTELPELAEARKFGECIHYPESATGNSGHYYVERNGRVEQWVPCDRVAHHVRGYNQTSIGIELINNGRYPDWFDSRKQQMTQQYPAAQIHSLLELLQYLCAKIPNLRWIEGHESLDTSMIAASDNPDLLVKRKTDPGPLFPWQELLEATDLVRPSSSLDIGSG